jgi:hypothetical protein
MRIDTIKYAAFLPCLLLLGGLAQAAELKPYTATYEVARNGDTIGHATVTLKQIPGGWDYESLTHGTNGLAALAAADIDEHSQISVNAGTLELRSNEYRLSTIVKSSRRSITVDPTSNRVVVRDKKHDAEYPMQAGALDQQSVTVAIAQDLANGKHGTLTYNVAGRNEISTQRYQVGKEQTLHVPAGSQRTVAVTRLRDSPGGRVTASWFGLDNGFVLVRSVQTEPNGEVFEMKLESLKR